VQHEQQVLQFPTEEEQLNYQELLRPEELEALDRHLERVDGNKMRQVPVQARRRDAEASGILRGRVPPADQVPDTVGEGDTVPGDQQVQVPVPAEGELGLDGHVPDNGAQPEEEEKEGDVEMSKARERRRQWMLDDVPLSIKRAKQSDAQAPRILEKILEATGGEMILGDLA